MFVFEKHNPRPGVTERERGMTATRWFAFGVSPQREMRVLAKLTSCGHMAFVPVQLEEKRVGRHGKRMATRPAVPGYVFVGFAPRQRIPWRRLRDVDGLRAPIGPFGNPSKIRPNEIEGISEYSGSSTTSQAPTQIRAGGKAKVLAGPFAGFVADVEKVTKKRAKVSVQLFGRPSPVEIPLSILTAA